MKTEIYKMSALELSEAFKDKTLSPVEAINSVLERIKNIDEKHLHFTLFRSFFKLGFGD